MTGSQYRARGASRVLGAYGVGARGQHAREGEVHMLDALDMGLTHLRIQFDGLEAVEVWTLVGKTEERR